MKKKGEEEREGRDNITLSGRQANDALYSPKRLSPNMSRLLPFTPIQGAASLPCER
jgi:hypothetical protein